MIPRSLLFFLFFPITYLAIGDDEIQFSRDVLPILSDRCFHCHGPDEANREADLRLDQKESIFAERENGVVVIAGDFSRSHLYRRITSEDLSQRMPPEDSQVEPLSRDETEILKRWIVQGAPWGRHWAFEKPVKAKNLPDDIHPIDALVKRSLAREDLEFSPRAEKHTLLRRVSFDLTGLPPALEETRAFLEDGSVTAYTDLVERLLESQHFGERMAMWWLDAARYSDTDGYQADATRNNWPWRDWVIGSFNQNKPFDQFTVEQFAGDLLPNSSDEQKLATCFHRNHMANGEGGRHPEESRIDYVIDRVNTMGTVWLGLTLGCTQCHSHKFDPLSQQDYYSLFAFFNSIDEDGRAGGGAKPFMKYRSQFATRDVEQAQKLVELRKRALAAAREKAEREFEPWYISQRQSISRDYSGWTSLEPTRLETAEGTQLVTGPDQVIQATGPSLFHDDYRVIASPEKPRVTGIRLEVFSHASHTEGKLSKGKSGEFILTDVKLMVRQQGESETRDIEFSGAIASAEKNIGGRNYGKIGGTLDDDPRNGWTTQSHDAHKNYTAIFALREPLVLGENEELIFVMLHRSTRGDANIGRFRVSTCCEPGRAVRSFDVTPLEQLAKLENGKENGGEQKLKNLVLNQFLTDHTVYQEVKKELDDANRQLSRFKKSAGNLNVMVLAERKAPRKTHILKRGVWDQKGHEVQRGFPAGLFGSTEIEPTSRLELARWLISRDNPLTARVVVNQLWQICFGDGLVRTPNDFGLRGDFPTQPELLDWLAVEFMEKNWDIKHILKLIVTSRTYQQSSDADRESRAGDPDNRWLSRMSRHRLPSWMIRDSALKTSHLLNGEIGGPTVMPYQPDGVWAEIFMGRFRYEPSQGTSQFRRTLYAFWRRSSAPTFLFDSSQRRVCEVTPRRTNTPLQALTLLNDLSMREAARNLAKRSSRFKTTEQQLVFLFQSVLSRLPGTAEMRVLKQQHASAQRFYAGSPKSAETFLSFGQPENRVAGGYPSVAALTVIASLIYNLDEAITRE